MKEEVIYRLKSFIESEARSCSMDFGCVTPLYVYRMWGGTVALNEIEIALSGIKNGATSNDVVPFKAQCNKYVP